ncbi:SusD/RagB family nutrient-binding outer membrane lipoprotein [Hymenobacter crusticola]|uniref:SusD/RagB family nutrient-binding outer membrane lipoprotein n=1 Tax=Hymenobacter crusticola TaxID=1770526 RepID=A0A243WJ07_9BACT|nr:SusD/RagB family nutrient-binding outer membrane lipoprotein [Hymenobacter crusticola]OUJ75533.1 hypothetical protein BXP70_05865 [Hymenobacter crusticola]
MKTSPIARYSLVAALALSTASCNTDKFLDVNTSPNNTTTVPPPAQLPTILVGTAFVAGNTIGRVTDLFVQHYAGIASQPQSYDRYEISGQFDNEWQFDLYANNLNGAQTLIANTQATSPAYSGIAKLIKAYNFALTTDLWGDIPYTEALQGLNNLHPRFDKQQDIYEGTNGVQSLFDLVRDGLADLDKTDNVYIPGATDDVVYKGNIASWKKMGNTLLLKLANTVSRRDKSLAIKVINEVLAKGPTAAISANTEDFEIAFGRTSTNQNPFYSYNISNRAGDQIASKRFLDSLAAYKDPRLPKFFTTTPNNTNVAQITTSPFGTFTGFENGNAAAAIPGATNRSVYTSYLFGVSGDGAVRLLTNFQRLFILAESALVLKTPGDANELYRQGITQSMLKTGLTQAEIDAYFAANPSIVNLLGTDEHKLNQIIRQKWIAFVGNGYESYNDYRRTGYPRLAPALNVTFTPNVPNRFLYPPSEISANGANVPSPLPTVADRVWWDID